MQSFPIVDIPLGYNRVAGYLNKDSQGVGTDVVLRLEGPDVPSLGSRISDIVSADMNQHVQDVNPRWQVVKEPLVESAEAAEYRFRIQGEAAPQPVSGPPGMRYDPDAALLRHTAVRVVSELAERRQLVGLEEAVKSYEQDNCHTKDVSAAPALPDTHVTVLAVIAAQLISTKNQLPGG